MKGLSIVSGTKISNSTLYYSPRVVLSKLQQSNLILSFDDISIDSIVCEGLYSCFLDAMTPTSIYNIGTCNIKLNNIAIT